MVWKEMNEGFLRFCMYNPMVAVDTRRSFVHADSNN